ncbi:MAG TPA: ROK family protein [Gemmatimonadaceae bacterium]|jgi:glucokinase|nr:ROK family protein [Gemmatimonadaceae bacterium]
MATKKRHQYIIGVDLGGTNIVVGAMSADGKHHHATRSIPTSAELGAEGVADRIVGLIEAVILDTIAQTSANRRDFVGVGIGAPGPLDREKGLVIVAPNLGWRNFPLRDRIGERLNLPATLDNDANCATVGEWWQGAAKGASNVIGMTIGTGIGGGLILDGKLFHGASDVAGEIGHTTIDLNGRHCKCGNYGCLEAYASGPAIATRAREVLVREETASLLPSLVGGRLESITAETVYRAAQQGDAVASEIVRDTARYLGTGIANLLNILNVDVVVVAGGVTAAGDALFVPMQAEVRRRAFRPAVDATRIVPGTLPGTAGVVGAVATFKMQHLGSL